jgi:hypothetical protein
MILAFNVLSWAVGALIGLGAALAALKYFKLSPVWAAVVGMTVFTLLRFPIPTHAVKLDMPLQSN